MAYFRCKPGELCSGADCCSGIDSVPSIGLGDWYRLSEKLGEPVHVLWEQFGRIVLVPLDSPEKISLSMGLDHEPCPFLEGNSCGVYDVRPLSCASFPYSVIYLGGKYLDETAKEFTCVEGVELNGRQELYAKALNDLVFEEAKIEIRLFQGIFPRIISFPHPRTLMTWSDKALQEEKKRGESKRARELKQSLDFLIDSGVVHGKVIGAEDFQRMVGAFSTSIYYEKVRLKLKTLNGKLDRHFRQFNKARRGVKRCP
jgi:Fe-S-cluster containining protein